VTELKDYYAILGVSPDADHADIEAGYERLSRIYQPDADAEPVDSERMRELDEAFVFSMTRRSGLRMIVLVMSRCTTVHETLLLGSAVSLGLFSWLESLVQWR